MNRHSTPRCSFCGKSRDKVKQLVAGPGVYICDQCVRLCNEVMSQEPPVKGAPPQCRPQASWVSRLFRLRSGWHRVSTSASRVPTR